MVCVKKAEGCTPSAFFFLFFLFPSALEFQYF